MLYSVKLFASHPDHDVIVLCYAESPAQAVNDARKAAVTKFSGYSISDLYSRVAHVTDIGADNQTVTRF